MKDRNSMDATMKSVNETIDLLLNHRSIRKFTDQPLMPEQVNMIVAAGQAASTSSNIQAYSVIAVMKEELKKELARLSGNQAYVHDCPVFLVWCADLSRLKAAAEKHQPGQETYEGTMEHLIVATVDTALAAQNAAIAAESLGLGIVYIGGIRNNIAEVADLLGLPELVYPLFGMCMGYPDQQPDLRPRLPQEAVLHWNGYDASASDKQVERYDEIMSAYLRERTGGAKDTPWSELMADKLAQPSRLHMGQFLRERGFATR
ncbi:oxygen-insensitive NADPH nitroreductase [Paenibacillus lentus]|uniref:Oxygen-insensitive NADPH nitroreductase n=1 Tax=Paenibacillus lentus TaxID=1338368 RepID=A0A3S8RQ31_9BACL|nr:oxygen-insensitive NADPH nitroreductase [Paenibacillus lentus]AZK45022.1 oxygen-insensitive NADPH nitroreductase [Paenibacillus lentus]